MTFREAGKMLREAWAVCAVLLFVSGNFMGVFEGTWIELAGQIASLLLFAWLILFAIGVSRGEPNP